MSPPLCCKMALAAALIVLPACILASAQTPAPTYDKSTEVKVQGTVEAITILDDSNLHLTLKSAKGALDVFVAPQKFLKQMGIIFHKGDRIEVQGSQLAVNGAPLLLAREITTDESDVITLRDGEGNPVWVGWIE